MTLSVASAHKISYHKDKVAAYLQDRPIYPATLELDLTSRCNRVCADCPSSRSPHQMHLSAGFVADLFAVLAGETRGLLLTGGEPTLSPLFQQTLSLAREKGFQEIAVVTNGSRLQEPRVAAALLAHATTIRLSMYDWDADSCSGIAPTLGRIGELRERIDHAGSPLKIGISILTSRDRLDRLVEIASMVRDAGAHWAYYHPLCTGWGDGHLVQADQTGVPEVLSECRTRLSHDGFKVFFASSRYETTSLSFDRYHAAHLLLVIGADGLNYLGPEVKYQPRFAIADVAGEWRPDFLHRPERLARIDAVNSRIYSALPSRHRGVLYNDYIDKLKAGALAMAGELPPERVDEFWFPHIL